MNGTGITSLPLVIRLNSANEGDWETKTYTDATFDEAVAHLQGTHRTYEDGSGGHKDNYVYVVATYPETFEEEIDSWRNDGRKVTRHAGEPVFGYEARITGRGQKYASHSFCEVGMASGTEQTAAARLRLSIYELAIRLAEAANTWPTCEQCLSEEAEREAKWAASKEEAEAKAALHAGVHEAAELVAHDHYAPHNHAVRADHQGVPCECGHERHNGKVCKECQKQTPRGSHGTPARVKAAGIMS